MKFLSMILFTLKISYTLIISFVHTLNLDLCIHLISLLASSEISDTPPNSMYFLSFLIIYQVQFHVLLSFL